MESDGDAPAASPQQEPADAAVTAALQDARPQDGQQHEPTAIAWPAAEPEVPPAPPAPEPPAAPQPAAPGSGPAGQGQQWGQQWPAQQAEQPAAQWPGSAYAAGLQQPAAGWGGVPGWGGAPGQQAAYPAPQQPPAGSQPYAQPQQFEPQAGGYGGNAPAGSQSYGQPQQFEPQAGGYGGNAPAGSQSYGQPQQFEPQAGGYGGNAPAGSQSYGQPQQFEPQAGGYGAPAGPPAYVPTQPPPPYGPQAYAQPQQQWGAQPGTYGAPAGSQSYAQPQQWGQPGYGGPAVPWQAAPPAPPPRKRRGLRVTLIAGSAVVVVAAAITGVALATGGESPTQLAGDAGHAVSPASGMQLTGTISGKPATFDVTKAGTVEGSYADADSGSASPVTMVTIGGTTYLKAPADFWTDRELSGDAGGTWAKAPASAVVMSFTALTPARIASALQHVGTSPNSASTMFKGKKAIRLTDHGMTYVITADGPGRLVQVSGVAGGAPYTYAVKTLTAGSIAPVFQALHTDVGALAGIQDPQATTSAVGKVAFGKDCAADTSCTITGKVTLTDSATEEVMVKQTVYYSATDNGKPFATCTDTITARTPPASDLTMACQLGGTTWKHWFDSHTGNFNTWAYSGYAVTVNAPANVSALQSELSSEQGSS